jgi:cellulose synthase/poly-beta-1,6-N-acetylglucosamine synthase-like glycosyltransferase
MFGFFLFLFLASILLILSTYAFYPLLLLAGSRFFSCRTEKKDVQPTVSVIIAACNEGKDIARKLENTLELEYPPRSLEILVGSDGSTDRTAEIAREFEPRGVRVFDFPENRGKTAVQNDLVAAAGGEILVFTDAASFLNQASIIKLVRNFSDQRVGCVAGKMRFVGTAGNMTTRSQGLYWRYEVGIRELESRLGSLIGVDGPLYAVRRECYVPLHPRIISDLVTPLLVREMGRRVVLEEEAVVDEEPTRGPGQESATRRRITLRGLVGLAAHGSLLNPLRHFWLTFQLVFHKLLRWFVGLLLLLNLLACAALCGQRFFMLMLAGHAVFYLLGGLGWAAAKAGVQAKALSVPYYFCLVNIAATRGIVDFLLRKEAVSWKPVR